MIWFLAIISIALFGGQEGLIYGALGLFLSVIPIATYIHFRNAEKIDLARRKKIVLRGVVDDKLEYTSKGRTHRGGHVLIDQNHRRILVFDDLHITMTRGHFNTVRVGQTVELEMTVGTQKILRFRVLDPVQPHTLI